MKRYLVSAVLLVTVGCHSAPKRETNKQIVVSDMTGTATMVTTAHPYNCEISMATAATTTPMIVLPIRKLYHAEYTAEIHSVTQESSWGLARQPDTGSAWNGLGFYVPGQQPIGKKYRVTIEELEAK